MDESPSPLEKAIAAVGTQAKLAEAINVRMATSLKQGHVWAWLKRGGRTPEDYCPAIEAATGIRCEELRPDRLWKRDDAGNPIGFLVEVQPFTPTPDSSQKEAA